MEDGGATIDARPDTCTDGRRDGDETHIDCGGSCPACPDGAGCRTPLDCMSGVCVSMYCLMPACDDGVQNGSEVGVDCGGGSCPGCPGGTPCTDGAQCLSGECEAGACTDTSCMDGIQNADETGIDCGGPLCDGCLGGGVCFEDRDCASLICMGGVCTTPACNDFVQNGSETDVDCGGAMCSACGPGAMCRIAGDCSSSICDATMRCTTATCEDGVQNQDETDIDCGGMTCPDRCLPDAACRAASDCESLVCTMDVCVAASCTDMVRNAGESDVDCGGATTCPRCPDYRTCTVPGDCVAAACTMGFCGSTGCMPFPGTSRDTFGYFGCSLPLTPATLPCPNVLTTGTAVTLSDDSHIYVPIGFTFNFYGTNYTNVAIESNGALAFSDAYLTLGNVCLPATTSPTSFVAMMWDDLYPSGGQIRYQVVGTAPNRQFVVTYDIDRFAGTPSSAIFSVVLEETTNHIKVCYFDTNFGSASYDRGLNATAGINNSGTLGLQFSCNTASLTDGLMLQYLHP